MRGAERGTLHEGGRQSAGVWFPARRLCRIMARTPSCLAGWLSSAGNDGKDCPDTVGGQALIEGVLMRGKEKIAWAVRSPSGEAVVESFPFVPVTKRVKALGLPVVRGVAGLFESMAVGYKALSRSADIAMEEPLLGAAAEPDTGHKAAAADDKESSRKESGRAEPGEKKKTSLADQVFIVLTMLAAMSISVGLFMYAPMWLANRTPYIKDYPILFNLAAGAVRIALLLIYMSAIGMWSETRRLFQYHGAEHKTILAYEDGKPLTFEAIDPYTTIHPRCGTSFLVLVAIVGILMSSVIDTLHFKYIGQYANLFHRFGIRLLFIPLLAGVSYEALKLSAKYKHIPVVNFLILPGLLVQRITTKKPDKGQVEIAVKALEAAV